MARRTIKVEAVESTKAKVVPKTKAKREDGQATFRSPHRGLTFVIKPCERVDHGAGSYVLVAPGLAEFRDMGSYGELVCEPEVAEILRAKAKDRETLGLPSKFIEV